MSGLFGTYQVSFDTCQVSFDTCQVSFDTCHVSFDTCQVSFVICQVSFDMYQVSCYMPTHLRSISHVTFKLLHGICKLALEVFFLIQHSLLIFCDVCRHVTLRGAMSLTGLLCLSCHVSLRAMCAAMLLSVLVPSVLSLRFYSST
jgi:hypothetical protein